MKVSVIGRVGTYELQSDPGMVEAGKRVFAEGHPGDFCLKS